MPATACSGACRNESRVRRSPETRLTASPSRSRAVATNGRAGLDAASQPVAPLGQDDGIDALESPRRLAQRSRGQQLAVAEARARHRPRRSRSHARAAGAAGRRRRRRSRRPPRPHAARRRRDRAPTTTTQGPRSACSTASSPTSAGSLAGVTTRGRPSDAAAVAAQHDADPVAAQAELPREPGRDRRLARAADRQVADHDDRHLDPLDRQQARRGRGRGARATTARKSQPRGQSGRLSQRGPYHSRCSPASRLIR